LLVDEAIVIQEARRRGVKLTSTLLVLETAKMKNLIKSIKVEVDKLIASGFRARSELIQDIQKRPQNSFKNYRI
jgi:predicted nucleic acid-binding protein